MQGTCLKAAARPFYSPKPCLRINARPMRHVQAAAKATATVPAPPAELLQEVEKLIALKDQGAPQEDLSAQVSFIEKLSAQAGTNKVFLSINNGSFRARTVEGRMTELGKKPISFAQLSFGQYQPGGTMVLPVAGQVGHVSKGPSPVAEQGYTLHAHFRLVDAGVEGVSNAICEWSQDPESPQRLNITFKAMRLEPVVRQPGDLEKWLQALQPHNPGMGDDGVLTVPLPEHKGTLDHLLMTEQYQLVKGNMGSVTLLVRDDNRDWQ